MAVGALTFPPLQGVGNLGLGQDDGRYDHGQYQPQGQQKGNMAVPHISSSFLSGLSLNSEQRMMLDQCANM
jgi:hypothetical protein